MSFYAPRPSAGGPSPLERSKTMILSQVAAETDKLRSGATEPGGDISTLTSLVKGLSAQVAALTEKLSGGRPASPSPPPSTNSFPVTGVFGRVRVEKQ